MPASQATLAERIEFEAEHNISEYSEETIERFNLVVTLLRAASDMVKRVDYLLNGDEDEDTFLALWNDRFAVEEEEEVDEQTED